MIGAAEAQRVYLHSICTELGSPRPLDDPALNLAHPHDLAAEGLRAVGAADVSVEELISRCVARTAEGLPEGSIDHVVLVSAMTEIEPEELELEDWLHDVPCFVLTGGGCSSFALALETAAGLVARGSRGVLVSAADVAGPHDRMLEGEIAVLSDAAASCVVAPEDLSGGSRTRSALWEIDFVGSAAARASLRSTEEEETSHSALAMATSIFELLVECREETGRSIVDYDVLLLPHYKRSVNDEICDLLGVDQHNVRYLTAADTSHCFTADGVFDLEALESSESVAGRSVLVLCPAFRSWGVFAVRGTRDRGPSTLSPME